MPELMLTAHVSGVLLKQKRGSLCTAHRIGFCGVDAGSKSMPIRCRPLTVGAGEPSMLTFGVLKIVSMRATDVTCCVGVERQDVDVAVLLADVQPAVGAELHASSAASAATRPASLGSMSTRRSKAIGTCPPPVSSLRNRHFFTEALPNSSFAPKLSVCCPSVRLLNVSTGIENCTPNDVVLQLVEQRLRRLVVDAPVAVVQRRVVGDREADGRRHRVRGVLRFGDRREGGRGEVLGAHRPDRCRWPGLTRCRTPW